LADEKLIAGPFLMLIVPGHSAGAY
jgi:hypothetical protein